LNVIIHQVHKEMGDNFPPDINDCEVCHTGGTPTENFPMFATPAAALSCDGTGNGKTVLSWEHTGDVALYIRSKTSPDGKLFATGNKTGSVETGKWVSDGSVFDIYDFKTMELLQSVAVNTTVLGCVGNMPGTFRGVAGKQHTNWMDHPSRLVCGSCHDYIDWETGEGHSDFNIAQPNDDLCGNCHQPTGAEFGMSVAGAHKVVYKSAQLPGIVIEILSVTDTNPGDNPTVKFSMSSKTGWLQPSDLAFFRLIIAGPNEDYRFLAEEFATGAVRDGDDWSYTFSTPLPDDAKGSFTAGAEAFSMVMIDGNDGETLVRETAENDVFVFAVTDDEPEARRVVVDDAKCENCHSNLALHGTIRHEPQYCVTCHQPAATDISQVQEGNEEQGIHFKYMVHKIHRGEDLANGYVVAGYGQSIHDYSHVEYPGDLRICEACHVGNSQQVPDSEGLLPTATPQDWWELTMPTAAACLSCHDDDDSAAHAYSNTTFFGEACGTCHGEGKSAAVDKVHAR
jgi:OmcA/MtrC family decaheme c-type cytochrome